jgi:hypothetical protein
MIKSMLLAAAVSIPVTPQCAPILADTNIAPKPAKSATSIFSSFTNSSPPAIAYGTAGVPNNIVCRNKARSKYYELGASDMSSSDSNVQNAVVNSMRASIWCRTNQVFIVVAGDSNNAVKELRDELMRPF